MATDIGQWQQDNTAALKQVKKDFLDALQDDESYIDTYEGSIVPDFISTYKNELTIALEPIDAVVDAVNGIEFVLPDRPPELDGTDLQKYKGHVFYDERLDQMEANLKELYGGFAVNTGYAFNAEPKETAIQTALYSKERELDEEDAKTKIDDLASAWAAAGYELAPGAMSRDISLVVHAMDRDRTKKTATAFDKLIGTVQKNIQWAFENGIGIEKLHMDFTIKYSEMSRVYIEAAVAAYITEINKRKDEMMASLLEVDSITKALSVNLKRDIAETRLELEENLARLSASIANFANYSSATASLIKDQITLANNISNGYESIFSAYGNAFIAVSYENQAVE